MLASIGSYFGVGIVSLVDLKGGLEICCVPEIDIIQTSVMVAEVLTSVSTVMRQRVILEQAAALTVDDHRAEPTSPERRHCLFSKIRQKLHLATYHCQELLPAEYGRICIAVEQVSHAVRHHQNLSHLDGPLYMLRTAARQVSEPNAFVYGITCALDVRW